MFEKAWRGAREAQGSGLLNRDARKASVGSNPTLSASRGPVSERLKEHDWKSCGVNSPRGFESHPVRWLQAQEKGLRDVAQPGRALASGARGRRFKSGRPD